MDLSTLTQLVAGTGGMAQIAMALILYRLDRRVYRLELKSEWGGN